MSLLKKIITYSLIILIMVSVLLPVYIYISVQIDEPSPENISIINDTVFSKNNFSCVHNNWFKKSVNGIWELYIEGPPFERGIYTGKLTRKHIRNQEQYFIDYINTLVPSETYRYFLKVFTAWFNRNMDSYINDEYKLEIYGISRYASDVYDYIGPKYQRMLNYHAAHDIGHALQNMKLVGCTAFAAWGNKSEDRSLIIGRTFDFYAGDNFAKEKIVAFINPESGYKYLTVTWGGMTGVVSGMNEHGLTVTINAAENKIPVSSGTPVSLIAREILQYSKTVDAALLTAQKRRSFVSESIMIGSALENRAVIIEKSPSKTQLVDTGINYIISTNHFVKNNSINEKLVPEESSLYRYKRVRQLLNDHKTINVKNAIQIIRDRKGLNNKDIGLGNEKTINQFLAHHAVIFKPVQGKVWISTCPNQLGQFICYDLKKIFSQYAGLKKDTVIYEPKETVPQDSFIRQKPYKQYLLYKNIEQKIVDSLRNKKHGSIDSVTINDFIRYNPEYFMTYKRLGDYYKSDHDYQKAIRFYRLSLEKEVARKNERSQIKSSLTICIDKENRRR